MITCPSTRAVDLQLRRHLHPLLRCALRLAAIVLLAAGAPAAGWAEGSAPAAPTIVSVAPDLGPTAGGTSITITGSNLAGTSSVTIGGVAATALTVVSATTVDCTTPAGSLGAADVVVTAPGGTATASGAFTYLLGIVLGPVPVITSISPTLGPPAGGTGITITGSGLSGTSSVTVGGAAATAVTVVSPTTVTCTTPPGSLGTADVVLTTPYGVATDSGAFTYLIGITLGYPPVITSAATLDGTTTAPLSYTCTASGSTPITFTLSGNPLPAGLTFDGTTISGTPQAPGVTQVTLNATNAFATATPQVLTIDIQAAATGGTQSGGTGGAGARTGEDGSKDCGLSASASGIVLALGCWLRRRRAGPR